MPSYRFEESPSNRAGCTNKECKDNKIKIKKDELRVGTWVDTERFQTWQWRHWGCTTPKVIENIVQALEEMNGDSEEKNYSLLSGWDELSKEHQEKIRRALAQGHVDDEDWKGDLEVNRPGHTGFRVRGGKKKADAQEAKDDGEESPAKGKPAATKKAAAKEKETESTDGGSAAEEEKPKAKAARGKKADGGESADADTQRKKTAGTKKVATKESDETEAQPKKRGRPAKAAPTEEAATETAKKHTKRKAKGDDQEETAEEKPKRRRPKKSEKAQVEEGEAEPAEKPKKRGRKKAAEKN